MAIHYVRSAAAGAGTGVDWTNAYTTLTAAFTGGAAGDDFYVSDDHAETQATALTLTCPGTVASPCRILCVNHLGSVPPVAGDLATTGTISTTGASNIALAGSFYCYGLTFAAASTGGAVAATMAIANALNAVQSYEACKFQVLGTNTAYITWQSSARLTWNNCTVKFGAAACFLRPGGGDFYWKNSVGVDNTGTLPTALFSASNASVTTLEGVDLSMLTAKALFSGVLHGGKYFLKDCKLPASFTTTSSQGDGFLTRCDSGATNSRNEKHNVWGDLTTTTSVTRTGGASDGTTAVAHQIVTASGASFLQPFVGIPLSVWNDTTGAAINVTVFGTGTALPNNDEVWMDVEYPGASTAPLGSFATTTKATVLTTGAANTTDASTWSGGTTPFSMTVSITPQMKGPITVYPKVGKASSTFYIDPKILLH